MSVISMTGYGKSESTFNGAACLVEVRSVNSRFLDIACKLPKELAYFENEVKGLVKAKLARGSVSVSVTLGTAEKSTVPQGYNAEAIEAYIRIAGEIKAKYGVSGEIKLEQVLAFPEVLRYDNAGSNDELQEHLTAEINKALDKLLAMREREGANLVKDLEARVATLETTLDEIKVLDPERITVWKEKFQERLKTLLGEVELDPARVIQEASIVADKLDINEEITRFKSHNKLFLAALNDSGAQGKKLNFILQEMGREANTLGTKCQDARIQALAIRLKDEVETMREQVCNVE